MVEPVLHLTRTVYFPGDRLPLELIRRTPQPPFPLHTHDFSELVIVLSGSGTHFTDTDEHTVAAGDAFIVEGGRAHGYRNVKGLELVNVLFDPDLLGISEVDLCAIPGYRAFPASVSHDQRATPRNRVRLGPKQLVQTEALVDALGREFGDRRPGYRSLATAYFMQIVGYLARCFSDSAALEQNPNYRLADALRYVEENLDRRISVRELVAAAQLSESSLLRGFRSAVGMSPMRYHLHLRIERACKLLLRPELSITDISYRTGFSDSNYFSRQFRKTMERSPRDYRRQAAVRDSGVQTLRGGRHA